jgi:uncharacterized protein (TIGR00730 family)
MTIARLISTLRAYIVFSTYLFIVFFDVLYGMWKLSRLEYAPVTIFGGTRLKQTSIYMEKAHQLAHMLASYDIPVLTGGGPGIMEAANCGALKEDSHIITTIAIGVRGLDEGQGFNKCARNTIVMRYFFARKWFLINYSVGFAVFPGGFGTLDELTELLTLIHSDMQIRATIVLIGVDYWKFFIEWIHTSALPRGLVSQRDVALFTVTDDIDEAFNLLKSCHRKKAIFSFH